MSPKPPVLAALLALAAVGWLFAGPAPPSDPTALAVRQLHDPAAGAELDAARRDTQSLTHLLPAATLLVAAGVVLLRTLTAREGES